MISRRRMLKLLTGIPLVGGFIGAGSIPGIAQVAENSSYRDFFKEFGLRTFINATGTHTYLTGSLMPQEVMDAINLTSNHYVDLNELQDKIGAYLAKLLKCEAAMVSAGAASALTLGTTACITGKDQQKIIDLPNVSGPQREVIVQKSHRFSYDHAVRNTGIKFIEVETRRELKNAINENTVMMLFFNYANYQGQIQDEEFVALGKKHRIPTFNDCAADVPPVEHLWKYTNMGFDLVTISGGKGLRGPQSTGLLLGRKELIEAARLNAPPNANTIGRGMKVNKEEIFGLMVAVERYLELDHKKEREELEERVQLISETASKVPGVETEIVIQHIGNHYPQVRVNWDTDRVKLTHQELIERLRNGHPSIETATKGWLGDGVFVCMSMARPGQERIVAQRLHEILQNAAV
jgi:uncharacterized pyridoxal phosphate-dependent enzyme